MIRTWLSSGRRVACIDRGGRPLVRRVRGAGSVAGMLAILLSFAPGCGSEGSSEVTLVTDPPTVEEKITGIVSAPNGVLAMAPRGWQSPLGLPFVSMALALQGVSPVAAGLPVSLSLLDSVDFADGRIDSPIPLFTAALTNAEGRYTIISRDAEDTSVCRKMLAAGGGDSLTRALVFSHEIDVNATSEALVRVLLDYVGGSQAQLCDFSVSELTDLLGLVRAATFPASGDTAAEINERAYQLAVTNRRVQEALRNFAP